jgi:hypothetical protein
MQFVPWRAWGTIIGQRVATQLVWAFQDAPELLSSHSEPYWLTVAASSASRRAKFTRAAM